jgi:hypothetical protein
MKTPSARYPRLENHSSEELLQIGDAMDRDIADRIREINAPEFRFASYEAERDYMSSLSQRKREATMIRRELGRRSRLEREQANPLA